MSYDPLVPDYMECPWPSLAGLRKVGPVVYSERYELYTITRYADVVAAAKNTSVFSSATPSTGQTQVWPEARAEMDGAPFSYPLPGALSTIDPPEHTLNRRLINPLFSARRVGLLEPFVRRVAESLAGTFLSRGEVEFIQEYAVLLPMTVITTLFGFPIEQVLTLKSWSDAFAQGLSVNLTPERQRETFRATRLWQDHLSATMDDLSSGLRPVGDDVISHLVTSLRTDGRHLTRDEVASLATQSFVGGNETTTNLLGGMLLLLTENPEVLKCLGSDPATAAAIVEESLRFVSPTQALYRVTTEATEVGGCPIPAGARVHLLWGSANHDPAVFEDAESFAPTRPNVRLHLAFGSGPHFCVGQPLARLEAEVTLKSVVRHMNNLRLGGGRAPEWKQHFHLRGLTHLHLQFDPVE